MSDKLRLDPVHDVSEGGETGLPSTTTSHRVQTSRPFWETRSGIGSGRDMPTHLTSRLS